MTKNNHARSDEGSATVAQNLGGGFVVAADALARLGSAIGSSMSGLAEIIQRLRTRQETIHALSGLDDAMLKDIGVQRHEIARLADVVVQAENDNQSDHRVDIAA